MKRNRQIKFGTFKCQCGCGATFTANYITRAPRYLDKHHRNKKLAQNRAAARAKKQKALLAAYKERKAALRKVGIKSAKALGFSETFTDKEFSAILKRLETYYENRIGGQDD